MVVVLALGTMGAGELMILSAQDSMGSVTQQMQVPTDASKRKASPQNTAGFC